jgi:dTDP-4-amino-4,6-dideoxygalactose transaminase
VIPLARPLIGAEERAAVDAVLTSGALAQGAEVAAFEEEFAVIVGGLHCIAVNSGTSALHLGLLAAGIGPGDEVIVPSFSFAATANAVRLAGAEVVFADIDPGTYCIDPEHVRSLIGQRTAAVMPVHLYGQPADMTPLRDMCSRHGLLLAEDAAQAHAASYENQPVGTFGTMAAFSFYPTKNMTTGEGGMIVTRDAAVARKARLLRNQGMEKRYLNEIVGFNARMTDIGAALGRVQLRRLEDWTSSRRHTASIYDRELRDVTTPLVAPGRVHVYHQYTLRAAQRNVLQARLESSGVASAVYYPVPIHRLPAYDLELELPQTDAASAEVLSIPVGPHLTDKDIKCIIEAVNA